MGIVKDSNMARYKRDREIKEKEEHIQIYRCDDGV